LKYTATVAFNRHHR